MPDPEIKPCPFCGGNRLDTYYNQGFKWGRMECADCGAMGPEVRTQYDLYPQTAKWVKHAIDAWNART